MTVRLRAAPATRDAGVAGHRLLVQLGSDSAALRGRVGQGSSTIEPTTRQADVAVFDGLEAPSGELAIALTADVPILAAWWVTLAPEIEPPPPRPWSPDGGDDAAP